MKKIAVIGAGISGLTISRCLSRYANITIFEKESKPGGLIKCDKINDTLYHMVGGHVFNSKRQDVLDWFWNLFSREDEFFPASRNAVIDIDKLIGYPIENHIYQLPDTIAKRIITELLDLRSVIQKEPNNFENFLINRFGKSLYNIYFKPYNKKIWKRNLSDVPISWLEGKLPMPTIDEIFFANILKEGENKMVHSSFFYPRINGSQFIADKLSEGLNIRYNSNVSNLNYKKENNIWEINNDYFDYVIFTGNIKEIPSSININICDNAHYIDKLEYHGTTSVLCKIDKNPYSWVYLPKEDHNAHRIICTGNFSPNNNGDKTATATVEFTDEVSKEIILSNLKKLPLSPEYITHKYTKYTYPIQNKDTRNNISNLKKILEQHNFYLLGRFAEWEYYNMDAAIGAAIDLSTRLIKKD